MSRKPFHVFALDLTRQFCFVAGHQETWEQVTPEMRLMRLQGLLDWINGCKFPTTSADQRDTLEALIVCLGLLKTFDERDAWRGPINRAALELRKILDAALAEGDDESVDDPDTKDTPGANDDVA